MATKTLAATAAPSPAPRDLTVCELAQLDAARWFAAETTDVNDLAEIGLAAGMPSSALRIMVAEHAPAGRIVTADYAAGFAAACGALLDAVMAATTGLGFVKAEG